MHLVDDIDAVLANLGRDSHLGCEVTDVIHRVVGCGIELVNGKTTSLVEATARLTLAASIALGCGVQTVDGLGEDAGASGLAHTSGATEQIGVGELSTGYGIFEGGGDVALAHNGLEGLWAVLACRNNEVIIHLVLSFL